MLLNFSLKVGLLLVVILYPYSEGDRIYRSGGRPRPLAAPSVQDCEYILLAFQAKPKRIVFA